MILSSFDIFDTALIRKCGLPENVFYLLANRLYPDNRALSEAFLLWRKQAEQQARHRLPKTDVSLEQIYKDDTLSGFTGYTPQQMMDVEIQVESENLIANPAIKRLIEKKREQGYRICFISDMYLDSHTLSDILRREGCLLDNEKVFVSCEHNARKSDGKLFDIVRKECQPSEWLHFGDNEISDVKIPSKKGIKTKWVNFSFTGTENRIIQLSKKIAKNYELSILVGLQRAARIYNSENSYTEIAADFIAPTYIPYVLFILNQAKKRGLKRLYFLSRDSFILMKMAEVAKKEFMDIELRYLFVSRKSLLMPYLTEVTKEHFLAAQDHQTIRNKQIDSLLAMLGTDRDELLQIFGIEFEYSRISTKKQEDDFLSKIFGKDSAFLQTLQQRCRAHYDLLHAYFKQEGIFDGTPAGMVDVGWLGTTRLMINSILKHAEAQPVEFFYFGIRSDVLPLRYGIYMSYYRPEQFDTELTFVIEDYFSASPYPTTIGYQHSSSKIVPQFPNNKYFMESPIVKKNVLVNQLILEWMLAMKIPFESILDIWASHSIDTLINLSTRINLSAFNQSGIIRKLTFTNLISIVLLGGHVTNFDRASLQLTVNSCCDKILWNLHRFTARLRKYLYVKLKK